MTSTRNKKGKYINHLWKNSLRNSEAIEFIK